MNPISFFIPAYNCAATIAESVDSIMATNYKEGDELIIVNDCSTDNTEEALDTLKSKYPVIKIITHKGNKGGAAARNTAIENAAHELLFCLDSDNILEDNSISALIQVLIDSKADIASFQEMRYFNNNNHHDIKYTWKFLPTTTLADFMADHKNPGSSGNYLFTKKSWVKANKYPEFAGALDTWGFCFKQLASGSKLVSLPGSGYYHRFGSESYYIRDMGSRNMSIAALQIILPYYYLIHPDDLDYITSKKHRLIWFENFDKKPIRILSSDEVINNGIKAATQQKGNILSAIYKKSKAILRS
jgi:glycosyltransferase involved in cell wall biosynthesis